MSHNKAESARFAQAADQATGKMMTEVEKALAASAARGFPVAGADTLNAILDITSEARGKIVEANGKTYEERSAQLLEIDKFALDYLVKIAKFAMELYREQLFNAIALEQAQEAANTERGRAEVSRINSQTEARMAAIIRDRAEMERRITSYKLQQVQAEALTVSAESILEDAKLSTAEKKLEIIDSIYQVLAAEQLVLAAERRRAASLQKVLAAQQIVAGIKKEMVPFYIQKAEARKALALATEQEIPVLRALEELGYQRVALRTYEESERHQERVLTLEHEMAQEAYTRAHNAHEIARRQLSTLIQRYNNEVKGLILNQKKQLLKDEVAFRLATGLARESIVVNNDVTLHGHEIANLDRELTSLLANISIRAADDVDRVRASAIKAAKMTSTNLWSKRIKEGFIIG
jgi:hypothetical protein